MLILFLVFIFPRIFFFIHVDFPGIDMDSITYWDIAHDINKGLLPNFNIRTPFYPFILYFIRSIGGGIAFIMILQSLICLKSVSFLYNSLKSYYPQSKYIFLTVISLFIFSDSIIRYESEMLPESLTFSGMILIIGLLVRFINTKNNRYLIFISVISGMCLLLRPTGAYLYGLFILISMYFLLKKDPIINHIKLWIPSILIILSLCSYNLYSLGEFTISPWGKANKLGTVIAFLEEDTAYPDKLNEAIRVSNNKFSNAERNRILNSWNLDELQVLYRKQYYLNLEFVKIAISDLDPSNIKSIINRLTEINVAVQKAANKHRHVYIKFVLTMYIKHLEKFSLSNYNFYAGIIEQRFTWKEGHKTHKIDRGIFTNGEIDYKTIAFAYGDYFDVTQINFDRRLEGLRSNFIFKFYDYFNLRFKRFLYSYHLLLIVFVLTFLFFAFVVLNNPKKASNEEILLFLISAMHFGSLLLVSLFEVVLKRYELPTEICVWVTIAFAIHIIMEKRSLLIKRSL